MFINFEIRKIGLGRLGLKFWIFIKLSLLLIIYSKNFIIVKYLKKDIWFVIIIIYYLWLFDKLILE